MLKFKVEIYRAFFETILNYGEDAKKSVLQSKLFYKDENNSKNNFQLRQTQKRR